MFLLHQVSEIPMHSLHATSEVFSDVVAEATVFSKSTSHLVALCVAMLVISNVLSSEHSDKALGCPEICPWFL